ncbi:MAG: succinate dehydrogenase, hydrophobic membrane anchor protein [Paracoccaceae bacterium]
MAYLTDRKRAVGLGSAREGAQAHWWMQVSAWSLAILIPLFVFTFGRIVGAPHAEVVAYYSQPFPAIVAALTLIVTMLHFKNGARVAIEDYSRGALRKTLIIGVTFISYAAMATGLFGLARIAL